MDLIRRSEIRSFVSQRLRLRGDFATLNDDDLLFTSGRLDSLDAVELIMFVETEYGLNFAKIDFDLTLMDSVAAIDGLVENYSVPV